MAEESMLARGFVLESTELDLKGERVPSEASIIDG